MIRRVTRHSPPFGCAALPTPARRCNRTCWRSRSRWRCGWGATWTGDAFTPPSRSRCAPRATTASWRSASCSPRASSRRGNRWPASAPAGPATWSRVDLQPGVGRGPGPAGAALLHVVELRRVRQSVAGGGARLRPPLACRRVGPSSSRGHPPACPRSLRAAQAVFDRTGGLHAAALFDADGDLLCLREDVGRHNALDKLIGAQFLAGRTPLSDDVLLVSGRVSFELVQKAAVAGIPDPGGRRRPVEPGGEPGPRTRPDRARLRPRGSLQHLLRRRAHSPWPQLPLRPSRPIRKSRIGRLSLP